MELGTIGLGRMGANIAHRLARNAQMIIVHNRTKEKVTGVRRDPPTVLSSRLTDELDSVKKNSGQKP